MADELDIRSSGSAAIDTVSLRSAADAGRAVSARLRCLGAPLSLAEGFIAAIPGLRAAGEVHDQLAREARRLETLAEDCEHLAAALDQAADLYELVEVHVAWALTHAGSAQRADLEARASAIGTRLWGVTGSDAAFDMLVRTGGFPDRDDGGALRMQAALGAGLLAGPLVGPLGYAFFGAVQLAAARASAVRARDAPDGQASRAGIAVIPLRRMPAAPVAGFADAAGRISGPAGARIRVERYAMPSGGREWVVYVTGTQSVSFGGAEPFDMRSNIALYDGRDADASAAVRAALADAGVAPGDPVHAFAHSQGAMAAELLAREGEYDIRTVVTFGAPTILPLPEEVTGVTVRHTDDPVAALAGPLPSEERGAPGGFVAERLADPLPGLHDMTMPAHALTAYAETAALLDASADPRARGVDPLWDRLASAESVRATEYGAGRVSRADADAAGAG